MPQQYLAALFIPAGRISQAPFALLCIVLAFGNIWVYAQAKRGGASSDIYMTVLLVLIWMKFCIMSRRMHDTGKSGAILVPILIFAMVAFLLSYDQGAMRTVGRGYSDYSLYLSHGTKIVRALFIAVFIYLIRAPSDDGTNAYGPEWDDIPDEAPKARATARTVEVAPVAASASYSTPAFSSSARMSRKAIARLASLGDAHPAIRGEPEPAGVIVKRSADSVPTGPTRKGFGRRG